MRKLSQRKLNKLLTRHQNWLDGKAGNARQLSLKNYDLTNIDFGGCILPKIRLENCKLDGMGFQNGNFMGSQFLGCSAKNTNWQGAILNDCDFTKSNCSHSNFKQARMPKVNLTSAVMEHCVMFGANMELAKAECARLHGSDLSFVNANGANFVNADLTKITARNLQAQKAVFARADRSNSDFSYANMRGCNCNEAIDNNVVMYKTDIRGSSYVKATVRDCLMPETLMDGNEFEGALFEGVVLYRDDGKNGFRKDAAPVSKAKTKPVTLKDFSIDDLFKELQRRMPKEQQTQQTQQAEAKQPAQAAQTPKQPVKKAAAKGQQAQPAPQPAQQANTYTIPMPVAPGIPSIYPGDQRMAAGAENMSLDEGEEIGD